MPDTLIPIRQWVDTYANLTTADPVLLDRQLAIESDTGLAKVGDGTTPYTLLPYVFGNTRGSGTSGQLVYWTGSQTVAGSANLSYNGATGLSISPITNATTNTGQFLVSDGGTIKYRSSSEMLSDLGATSGSGVAGQVAYWGGTNALTGSSNFTWNEAKKSIELGSTSNAPSTRNTHNIVAGGWLSIFAGLTNGNGTYREILSYKSSSYVFNTGADYCSIQLRTQSYVPFIIAANTQNVGISNTSPTARLHVNGTGTTSATTALQVENSTATPKLVVKDDGSIEVGKNDSGTTQSTASITVTSADTDTGLALVTKGNGPLTRDIANGATSGGNTRGINAVDLQKERGAASHVASGSRSVLLGGYWNSSTNTSTTVCGGSQNSASGTYAFIGGGQSNGASGSHSTVVGGQAAVCTGQHAFVGGGYGGNATAVYATIVGGYNQVANGSYTFVGAGAGNNASGSSSSIVGGEGNVAAGQYSSIPGGFRTRTYLYGQNAIASGSFAGGAPTADSQTSNIRYRNSITGTSKTELFLDGATIRAILSLPSGATNARAWSARVQVVAICNDQGDGTIQAGDSFFGVYSVGIKRVGTATSLIGGGVLSTEEAYDTNMSDAVIDITADDTNEALKLEFTPPTTAGSTSVIRVVATVYLTEVGY